MDRIEEIRERIEDGERHFDYVEVTYLLSVIEEKDREMSKMKNTYDIFVDMSFEDWIALNNRAEQAESDKDFAQSKLRVTKDVLDNIKKQLEQAEARCAEINTELTYRESYIIELQSLLAAALELIDGVSEVVEIYAVGHRTPYQKKWVKMWLEKKAELFKKEGIYNG